MNWLSSTAVPSTQSGNGWRNSGRQFHFERRRILKKKSVPDKTRKRNYEETIVERFLQGKYGSKPVFEPLGKSLPPDYSVGNIAFEVRRLNENIINDSGIREGLENKSIPLRKAILGELSKIPFDQQAGTYFVGLSFRRPIQGKYGAIAKQFAGYARTFYSSRKEDVTFTLRGVEVRFLKASRSHGRAFILGVESDEDSGGILEDIYSDNIGHILAEKVKKTRAISRHFKKWVLLLVDSIMPGYDFDGSFDTSRWIMGHFDKIVVIDQDGKVKYVHFGK